MAPAWKAMARATEKFLIDNSPGILTGLGVAGAVTTTVLTGRATYSAAMTLADQHSLHVTNPRSDMRKEYVRLVWKEYIPAAVALSATVTAIIMANQIGSRRAAAITAAFKLSEQMSEEYREKVLKTLGHKKEEEVRAEVAQSLADRSPGFDLIIAAGSESIFFDELSGRYFKNDIESVRKAVNEINYDVNNSYYSSLSDFYEKIGLEKTKFSDEVGWNTDGLLDVRFSAILLKDNRPAISITYNHTPIHGYDRCA
jgi:hypothetical protein